MIAEAVALSTFPQSHVVLGVRLRPLSIGHLILLHGIQSAFVEKQEITLQALVNSVFVCRYSFQEISAQQKNAQLPKLVRDWQRKLAGGLSGKLVRKCKRMLRRRVTIDEIVGFSFEKETAAFFHYLNEFGAFHNIVNDWAIPGARSIEKGRNDNPPNSPFYLLLLDALVSECGVSKQEALDMPLPLARWTTALHQERKGKVRINPNGLLAAMKEDETDQQEANQYLADVLSGKVKIK